jgi:hypothetical protein
MSAVAVAVQGDVVALTPNALGLEGIVFYCCGTRCSESAIYCACGWCRLSSASQYLHCDPIVWGFLDGQYLLWVRVGGTEVSAYMN